MSRKSEIMHLDTRMVQSRMNDLNRRILPSKIRAGLAGAGNRLMIDVVIEEPTAPIRRPGYGGWSGGIWLASGRHAGELRASGALFVDGVKKRTTVHYGEMATGRYQPHTYGGEPILKGSHEACVVFNAPYAAEQHEAWAKKTQPRAGMYYLSNKLYGNAVIYMGIIARAIKL